MKRSATQTAQDLFLAFLTAWLLPSYLSVAAVLACELAGIELVYADMMGFMSPSTLLVGAPFAGLVLGLPCFLVAFAAWALLHRFGQVRPGWAALIGALVALMPLGWFIFGPTRVNQHPGLGLLMMAVGAVTGLAVWWVACRGRTPTTPRPPRA